MTTETKKNIILAVCVLAFLALLFLGYKWIIEKLEETRKNGDNYNPGNSGSSSSSGSSSASNATNNANPVLYEVGEKLFTFGEYANLRDTPEVDNIFPDNFRGTLKGEIGQIDKVVKGLNGDTHTWYHVKLTTPIKSSVPFLEYTQGYVRDDVVTNIK